MRNNQDRRVQRFTPGQRTLKAAHLNSIVEAVNRPVNGVSAPKQPRSYGKVGSAVEIFTFVSDQGDYLVCQDANSNNVYIAKPYELRQTPFDGESVGGVTYSYTSVSQRTATSDSNPSENEIQYITPNYVSGAEIYASKVSGGTGIDNGASPAVSILYLEINQGRAWAWDPNA